VGGTEGELGDPPHIPDSPTISSSWRLHVHMAEGACIALFFAVPVPSVDPVRSVAPALLHLWRQWPLSPSPSSPLHLPFLNPTMSESPCTSCCGLTDIWTPTLHPHGVLLMPILPTHISLIQRQSNIREACCRPLSQPPCKAT
jgi:hypothetical protein